MHALEQTWSRVGFESPSTVERLLVHGSVAGAIAGAAGALLGSLLHSQHQVTFGVALIAAVLLLVLPQQALGIRLGLGGAAAALPLFLPWTPAILPYFFTVPLGLTLAQEASTPLRKLGAAVGPSLGAAWCLVVERWLSARHLGVVGSYGWLTMLWAGLFISAGAALAWVRFAADAVEPRLADRPKVLAAWVRLRVALEKLPKGAPRAELESLVLEGADRCLNVRAERDQVASALDETAEQDARQTVTALRERMEETADAELKAHYGQLVRVHQDTLEQVDGLRRRVERLDARESAEVGWLEMAAFSVELAPRSELAVKELAGRIRKLTPVASRGEG